MRRKAKRENQTNKRLESIYAFTDLGRFWTCRQEKQRNERGIILVRVTLFGHPLRQQFRAGKMLAQHQEKSSGESSQK